MPRLNLIGQRFNYLVVIKFSHVSKNRQTYWICQCDCGRTKKIIGSNLTRKYSSTRSCGCLSGGTTTHGMSKTKTYYAYVSMISRCNDQNLKAFPDYGGRGIKVCPHWENSFQNFLADMGEKPSGMSLGRINNDGNYNPVNCRWMTTQEQANNKRNTTMIKIYNCTLNIDTWAKIMGINPKIIRNRIHTHKWSPQEAVLTPINSPYRIAEISLP